MPKKSDKEFILKALEIKEEDFDSSTGEFEGFASKFDAEDAVGDIIEAGAFKRTLKNKGDKRPLLWQHDTSIPIGSGYHKEVKEGLKIKGKINLGTDMGRNAAALIKAKDINGLSIGFTIDRQEFTDKNRIIKEINLWETSVATFPCLDSARISTAKSLFYLEKDITKAKLVCFQDALKFLDDFMAEFDEAELIGYKSNIESLISKASALLLKAGIVVDPFSNEHSAKSRKSEEALAKVLSEAREIKNNFLRMFKDA